MEGWNEHKLMILSELKSLHEAVDKIDVSVCNQISGLETSIYQKFNTFESSVDSKINSINDRIRHLDIEMAIQKTKSGIWGALGGVIATLAIILMGYIQGK